MVEQKDFFYHSFLAKQIASSCMFRTSHVIPMRQVAVIQLQTMFRACCLRGKNISQTREVKNQLFYLKILIKDSRRPGKVQSCPERNYILVKIKHGSPIILATYRKSQIQDSSYSSLNKSKMNSLEYNVGLKCKASKIYHSSNCL